MEVDMKQEIIYISKLVITSFAILIYLFMEQAKKDQQSNQSHDTTMIDESKLLQRSVDVSYDNSNH